MSTRKITTYYEVADGTEPITLEVEQDDRFMVNICTDLAEMGVPTDERFGVIERATEGFWRAERAAYLRSNPDAD